MLEEKIRTLIEQGDWDAIDKTLIPAVKERENGLQAGMLLAATLRFRNDGKKANQLLAEIAENHYTTDIRFWSQFAEELIQSGLWHQAKDIISKITNADQDLGKFLQLIFFRETDNWAKFNELLPTVIKIYPALAELQAAWAELRRGQNKKAEIRLQKFRNETAPPVLKLLARYEIATRNIGQAIKYLELAKKQQPMDWECMALEGLCKPQEAFHLWSLALQRQPAQAETLVNRARMYAEHGRWIDAENDCMAALSIKPWNDMAVLLWVNCLLAQKKHEEARLFLEKQIEIIKTPGRISAQLDLLRARSPKGKELKEAAEKALHQYPEEAPILLSVGAAFQKIGLYDRAAKCYEKRLELLPDDVATRNNLAQLYLDRDDIELGIEAWRKIGAAMDDTILLNYAQGLQRRGDTTEAEEIFAKILKKNPRHPVAMRGMADVLAGAGDYIKAWELVQSVIEIDPEHPRTWLLAANLQGALGTPEMIPFYLEKGAEQCKDPLKLHQNLVVYWNQQNQFKKAEKHLLEWAEVYTDKPEYWLILGELRSDRNDFSGAEQAIQKGEVIDWQRGGASLVRFYESRNRLGAARRCAEQMVRKDPAVMKHHGLLAEVLYKQELYEDALKALDTGLKYEPFRLSLTRQKIGMLLAQERYSEAEICARKLLDHEVTPPHIAILLTVYNRSRDHAAAVKLCYEMLEKYPEHRVFSEWLAECLVKNQELKAALEIMKQGWVREPRNLKQAAGYISCLILAEEFEEAYRVAKSCIDVAGERPDGIIILTEVMRNMGHHEEALAIIEKGIENFPKHQGLAKRRVDCLRRLGRRDEEIAAIHELMEKLPPEQILAWASARLLQLDAPAKAELLLTKWQQDAPESLEPRWAAFGFLKEQKRHDLAQKILDTIERRKPGEPQVLLARAGIYSEEWRMNDAIEMLRKAVELRPDNTEYVVNLLNFLVKAGNFDEFDALMSRLKHLYGDHRYRAYSEFFFNINCHPEWSAQEVYQFYHDWYTKSVLPFRPPERKHLNVIDPNRKIRIGYVSPDLRRHAVAYFSEPLLINHDRNQFELFAFAHLELKAADAYTDRFKKYFDHWIETAEMSKDEFEKSIVENQIDILIDLAGHTANNSLEILLRKPAPIQASYLFGAGQTTGLPEVDYLICDSAIVPPEHAPFVAEKVVRLPFSGLPYLPPHDFLDPVALPMLKNGFVTFGVLARPLRTNRRVFAVWAEILRSIPNSRLRFDHIPYAEANIQERIVQLFAENDIGREQLIFRNTRPHWKAYQEIDIQLDPFPAGSGTTITEGLWMERIAIGLKSRPPMGRFAVAQLTALGLTDECCAENEQDYIKKAVSLASDALKLKELSEGLREKMKKSRLMDYKAYAHDVAACYRNMWVEYCKKMGG